MSEQLIFNSDLAIEKAYLIFFSLLEVGEKTELLAEEEQTEIRTSKYI